MFVAKAEAAKTEAFHQTPSERLYICTHGQWWVFMAIIAGLSDKELSYNSVKMTQKSCFLLVAEPIWSRLRAVSRDFLSRPLSAQNDIYSTQLFSCNFQNIV